MVHDSIRHLQNVLIVLHPLMPCRALVSWYCNQPFSRPQAVHTDFISGKIWHDHHIVKLCHASQCLCQHFIGNSTSLVNLKLIHAVSIFCNFPKTHAAFIPDKLDADLPIRRLELLVCLFKLAGTVDNIKIRNIQPLAVLKITVRFRLVIQ